MTAGSLRVSLVPPRGTIPARPQTTAVVIDVLRATSTISAACANGAARVVAFEDPSAALAYRQREANVLVCGEREGRVIEGFDLGNSPSEYARERVASRTLAFASTNGSRALRAASGCRARVPAAFTNASAVLRALGDAADIWIIAAGKLGEFALEDAALAGWLTVRLRQVGWRCEGTAAELAVAIAPRDAQEVRASVEGSDHGRYLRDLAPEFAADVAFCGELDALGVAHQLDRDGRVSVAAPATS